MNAKHKIDRTEDIKVGLAEISFLVPTALGNVLNDFLTDRDISGVRPATLSFYRNELKPFINWAGEAGAQSIAEITPDLLRAYFLALRQQRNQSGIHKNFTVIKTWLRWAWEEYDQAGPCPITKVKVATAETAPQPALELDKFSKLLSACKGKNEKRDKAILLFLLDTGIRRQEICRLTASAIKKDGTIQLEAEDAKTGEARKVFLTRDTQKALRAYLAKRINVELRSPLFATQDNEPFSPAGMRQVIKRLCHKAGLPEAGMHSFRRGFALESLRAGADLASVSRLLGHRRIQTTMRYLPQTEEDLRSVHERTSPVNRLKHRK